MAPDVRKARDLALLDAIEAFPRVAFEGHVWRTVRDGRDPTVGGPSRSRWCKGEFDVLYTSLNRDGAIAEIDALLALQPVTTSKVSWLCYELTVRTSRTLRLADLDTLRTLGVDTSAYRERSYDRTQAIADSAYFLGFDGLIVPSARWECENVVLFTGRLQPDDIELRTSVVEPIDWAAWRRGAAARSRASSTRTPE